MEFFANSKNMHKHGNFNIFHSFFNEEKAAERRIIDHNRLDRTGDRALSIIPQRFYGQELGQLGGTGGLIVSGSPATLRMLGASAWDAFMDIMDQAAS